MSQDEFFPLQPMPPEIARALGWSTTPPADPEAEELAFFEKSISISNPWQKPPEGSPPPRLQHIDEAEEERRAYAIPALDKLVHKDALASVSTSNLNKNKTTTQTSEDGSWHEPISIAHAPIEKTAMSRRETALREYFQRAKEQNADFGPEDYAEIAEEEGDAEHAALLRQIAKTL